MVSDLFPACDRVVRDELARAHWPEGMAFDAEHEELLARGWPHLCRLVDGDPKKAVAEAWKVLSAIDPVMTVDWPRETARRYVHALAREKTPRGHEFDKRRGGEGRSKRFDDALAITGDPTREEATMLVRSTVATLDGYPFHWQGALFLLEAFLGTDVIAEIVVGVFEELDEKAWAFENLHNRFFETIFALECFLLRSDPETATRLAKRVRAAYAKRPADTLVAKRFAITIDGSPAYLAHKKAFTYAVPFLTADATFIPKYVAEGDYPSWLVTPQLLRLAGMDIATDAIVKGMRRDGPWKQLERTIVFAPIKHPRIVELFAAMVGSKGAKGRPEVWLAQHIDFAGPTITKLIAAKHPQAPALTAIVNGRVKVAPPKKLGPKQLDAKVGVLFARIVADIERVRGDHAAEAKIWHDATHALIELRIAGGHEVPNERVGHAFGLDGWGEHGAPVETLRATSDETERWFSAIDAASDT